MSRYSRLQDHQKKYIDFIKEKSTNPFLNFCILLGFFLSISTLYLRAFLLPPDKYSVLHNLIITNGILLFITQMFLMTFCLAFKFLTVSLMKDNYSFLQTAVGLTSFKKKGFNGYASLLTWPLFAVGAACMGWVTVSVISIILTLSFYILSYFTDDSVEVAVLELSEDKVDWLMKNYEDLKKMKKMEENETPTIINKYPPPDFSNN